MKEFKIGDRSIGQDHPVFVIAEAGNNHQGELKLAKELIDIACFCKADAVKFQKRCMEKILTRQGLEAPYNSPNAFAATYGAHREALELSEEEFREIKRYADSKGIVFLASAWDEVSADFLDELDVPAFKTASADLSNIPLLEHLAKKGKPVIVSTGMSNMEDVQLAYDTVKRYNQEIALLQCTSTYPSKFEEIHLEVIRTYAKEFDCVVGYSGHELGIAVCSAAVALGAKIVERHFTIDRTMKGSDHAASLEPAGLQKLVRDIRSIEKAMGNGVKKIRDSEVPIKDKLAKSLVAAEDILKGSQITDKMLTTKGPGTGILANRIGDVVGRTAKVNMAADTLILEEHLD